MGCPKLAATASGTQAAAASGEIPADTRTMITNPTAADAYPISCFTWIILYKEQAYADRTQAQAKATVDLLKWIP